MPKISQQAGVSILMAMTLVVIVTSILANAALSTYYTLHRSGTIVHLTQASTYNQAALNYAKTLLRLDSLQNSYDSSDETWAQRLPAYPVEGGEVSAYINDLSGHFNLTNLTLEDPFEAAVFRRLFAFLSLSTKQADKVIDTARRQQYSSVIGLFAASQLSEAAINRIAPYFAYFPSNAQKININTTPAEILAAYFDLTIWQAQSLKDYLTHHPLKNTKQLSEFGLKHGISQITIGKYGGGVLELRFAVSSRFFQVISIASVGNTRATLVATIDRIGHNVQVISQRLSKLTSE